MKKLKIVSLVLGLSVIFAACSNDGGGDENEYVYATFPENTVIYTVPDKINKISFTDIHEGKECFVIYSNEKTTSQMKALNYVDFNKDENESYTAINKPEIIVNKHAIRFEDGTYRDELHFNYEKLLNIHSKEYRAAETSNGTENYYNNHSNNKFYVMSDDLTNAKLKEFELKEIGDHCRIWLIKNDPYINNNNINFTQLSYAIDNVFLKEINIFGSNVINGKNYAITTDNETKLDVLIYDIAGDGVDKPEGGVFGYFRPLDFYQNNYLSTLNDEDVTLTSNECQVINVDSYFLKCDLDGYEDSNGNNIKTHKVESTLIHEFEHLLNFCTKGGKYSTWYTEMLAMCAEDIFQTDINLSDIDAPKSRFDITFNKPYIGFKDWPQNDDENVYYAYANSYAFGAYLMRNYGGINLIHNIATLPYLDEEAITHALYYQDYEEETFESVLRKFGAVYALTEKDSMLTLNKEVKQYYGFSNYELTPIDLSNYIFNSFNTLDDLKSYVKTNLYNSEFTYFEGTKAVYLCGPEIYKSTYKMTEPINPYGFTVFYVGKVQSDKTLSVNHTSNLSVTLVLK